MKERLALAKYLGRRIVQTVFTLWALATIVFLMMKVIPGDEAQVAAGADASPEQVEIVRHRFGLDAPTTIQYVSFLGRLFEGDLGTSIITYQPVVNDLERVLPATVELVLIAMTLNLSVAIPMATIASARRGKAFDSTARVLAVIAGGLPVFWLAIILQHLAGSVVGILPISGQHQFGMASPVVTNIPTLDALIAGNIQSFWDAFQHNVLPATALAVLFGSQIFRTMRASLLGVLEGDFVTAVRAKGASPARVLLRHAIPNGLNPVIILAGTQLGMMIGTAVLVETVFARQGVGAYLANSVAQKDTYAVLGTVIFVGATVCIINLVVDILQIVLDPRIRTSKIGGRPHEN